MKATSRISSQSGYSLVTTMILVGLASALMAASLTRTLTVSRLNDRSNAYLAANAVAEGATEKVLSQMMYDFTYGGEQTLTINLATYQTGLLPSASENSVFGEYAYSDGQGGTNRTYVARTTTNANAPYVTLLSQYPGLSGFASTYRVVSNVRPLTGDYGFTGAVQQDVQMAQIPIFQFAIFYNSLLEFTWAAPLTVKGRVHCNTNIYVGSSADLDFNYTVTTAGVITNPAWGGHSQGQYTGAINYNGNPGFGTHEPVLTLPIGTNGNDPNAVRQIIYPPPPGETATNPISIQRYFNQAYMLVAVSDSLVTLTIKNSMYDPLPLVLSNGPPNTVASTNWTNINAWNISSWLSTNTTFYDDRENRNNHTVQIDVGRLASWIGTVGGATNRILTSNKWMIGSSNQFNGVLYVADWRTTNSSWMDCVRLTNGVNVTNALYGLGFTVATPNPLYVMGNYNCPNPSYLGSTNTTQSRPCSFACDALTILSGAWADSKSALGYSSRNNATSTTVDAAILAGIVYSTDSSGTGFSGGVVNLPRLLENWSTGSTSLTLNTSMVCLYNSVQATTQFVMPGTYYNAPTQRNFWFDQNFTLSTGLPPGTPKIDQMIRATWCNPPPGTVTYNPSPTLDYVAR